MSVPCGRFGGMTTDGPTPGRPQRGGAPTLVRPHGGRRPRAAGPGRTLALAVLVGLLPLVGCIQRGDAMPPVVAITSPRSGATSTTANLNVWGYAMDDDGIRAIRVNGGDLLDDPAYAGERGRRLVQFGFQIVAGELRDGDVSYLIEVEDVGGRVTTYPYRLLLDSTPPSLELGSVTPLAGGRLRVMGVARDNTLVTSVRINDVPLQFTPAATFEFSVDVADVAGGEIVVEDAAGNVTRQALR